MCAQGVKYTFASFVKYNLSTGGYQMVIVCKAILLAHRYCPLEAGDTFTVDFNVPGL